jgi:hypothetical protein
MFTVSRSCLVEHDVLRVSRRQAEDRALERRPDQPATLLAAPAARPPPIVLPLSLLADREDRPGAHGLHHVVEGRLGLVVEPLERGVEVGDELLLG